MKAKFKQERLTGSLEKRRAYLTTEIKIKQNQTNQPNKQQTKYELISLVMMQ